MNTLIVIEVAGHRLLTRSHPQAPKTVVDGREQLPEIGRKVLWEGAQEVVFSLA